MLAPNQEAAGESRIDKMRKFLSSPLTRKKPSSVQCKTFGTPLDSLLQRSPSEHSVPFVITRLCQYILKTGLTHEGLFRISGNARSVERLKVSFDRSGDAPLETEGDVPSAAALLKLFLRELPDPIIPLTMHGEFLDAVKDKDKEESIVCLTELVEKLPPVNYSILNYLFDFLLQVSKMEDHNRMSASSLGIVFGPNLFRVTEDFIGLKEQSLTNQIVTYFISEHDKIFQKETGSFTCHTCYSSESQNAAMIASWPEAKGNSTSMLSTWSLGPLSAQNETSDDDFLSLSSLSHSLVQSQANSYISLKCPARTLASENDLKQLPLTSGFSSRASENISNENSLSPPFKDCLERRSSVGKEFYIMEEEPILCHSSLSDQVSASSPHSSPFHKNDQAAFGSPSMSKSPNTAKEEYHLTHSLSIHDHPSDSQHPVCIDLKHNTEMSEEKTEMLKDSHKIYPRGRRRFNRHHKSKTEVAERRSQSELRTNTHLENEDEFNGNPSGSLSMYDKTDVQHNSTGNMDEGATDSRHSWPAFKKCRDEEDIALSPLPQQLGVTVCEEASISPSAFRSYLSHRNLHLDPNLPPSPPVEQEDRVVAGSTHESSIANSKQLLKKVHSLKKKIKSYEENYEKIYGFKPSHSDKSSNIAVKKMLLELNKARQDLRDLKDSSPWEIDSSVPSKSTRGTNTRSSQGLFSLSKSASGNLSIEDTIKNALSYLNRHRTDTNRPEDLEAMNKEQLIAEKIAVQKVLLNFESLHGRPASKAHRELVRPLYDRYRSVKRLIARSSQSKDNADLVPILEGETMEFKKSEGPQNLNIEPKAIESKKEDEKDQNAAVCSSHINFHEYSLEELESEINTVKEDKRRLRKNLKDFEDQFKKEHGRKVQREDKHAMESCYTEYKNAKAKLKLLEALVAKYEQTS